MNRGMNILKIRFICAMVVLILLIQTPAKAKTTYDLREISGESTESLQNGLVSPLNELAGEFILCEKEHEINAIMLASIAALESGWGTSDLAEDSNNLFGWTCDDGGYMEFDSKEECIQYVAQAISEKYISEDGEYYSGGTTIEHIADLYCDQPEWEEQVNGIIFDIMWRIESA